MKLILLLLPFIALSNEVKLFEGTAYSEKGEVLYQEKHKVFINKDKSIALSSTQYFDSKNKKIASLDHDYSTHPFAPEHIFKDERLNYQYGLKVLKKNKAKMFSYENEKTEEKVLELKENSISSQGFNHYLSTKLDKVVDGEVFDFIIPGKMTRVSFKVGVEKNEETIRFTLEADSFFIRLIAPKMIIDYSLKTGDILYYHGPSNLTDLKGNTQIVKIKYQY